MGSRRRSDLEKAVIEVLKNSKKPLSMLQMVEKIQKKYPLLLTGQTPKNTLYAMIYKREKRRAMDSEAAIIIRHNEGRSVYYKLMDNTK
ncbi:HTH domain-containing protein [Rahnella sp. PAMC25617]|uniref:HTH domain-containing protein n=1 Tax=Rahnella sp. PAMC25617 TaxID=3399684 RepID=UPI003D35C8C8